MEMKDRDLYFYINAPTPYRKHMFQLYARSFRSALFHFHQTTTCHPTWDLKCDDWAIDYVYESEKDYIRIGPLRFTRRMLQRFFKQRKGSVYIGKMLTNGDRLLVNILGFLHLAVVLHINDAGFSEGIGAWQRFKNRINYFGVCGVLSPGIKGREYSRALGFKEDQIINCYFSHDVNKFLTYYKTHQVEDRRNFRRQYGIPQDAIVILTISRYMALKRLIDAAEALALIEQSPLLPQIHYVLIGQGECVEHQSILAKLKKIVVHQMADVEPDRVGVFYCASDVFLFPSEGDIWGLVINEAMSMHLPIICTNVIGAAELVDDGFNGYVVPPRCPEQLAKALVRVIWDDGLRDEMGRRSFEKIKTWCTDRGLIGLTEFLRRR